MAKRYSPADQQKILQDRIQELRAKGADVQSITSTHPGGMQETLRQMKKDEKFVIAQAQEQQGDKSSLRQREKESQEMMERRQDERKKGSYE